MMFHELYASMQDDYMFCMCVNLKRLIEAWDAYDGENDPVVLGRSVNEHSLVWALYDLGHPVVVG